MSECASCGVSVMDEPLYCSKCCGGNGNTLDPIVRQDIERVVGFVLGYWPGYEDAISWGDDLNPEDYDWYMAARRLKDVLANASREA